ncbi:nickel insertion protein, partial [[Clostridium] scindens]
PFEATTPTGAAILTYLTSDFTDVKDFKINKIGYGIGMRDNPDVPNILRVFIGESKQQDIYTDTDQVKVMECNIDD